MMFDNLTIISKHPGGIGKYPNRKISWIEIRKYQIENIKSRFSTHTHYTTNEYHSMLIDWYYFGDNTRTMLALLIRSGKYKPVLHHCDISSLE